MYHTRCVIGWFVLQCVYMWITTHAFPNGLWGYNLALVRNLTVTIIISWPNVVVITMVNEVTQLTYVLFGVSLSEPHTSVTALPRMCIYACWLVCLDRLHFLVWFVPRVCTQECVCLCRVNLMHTRHIYQWAGDRARDMNETCKSMFLMGLQTLARCSRFCLAPDGTQVH